MECQHYREPITVVVHTAQLYSYSYWSIQNYTYISSMMSFNVLKVAIFITWFLSYVLYINSTLQTDSIIMDHLQLSYHINIFLWGCSWTGCHLWGWGCWASRTERSRRTGGLCCGVTWAVFLLCWAVRSWRYTVWAGLWDAGHRRLSTHMVVVFPVFVLTEGATVPSHITTTARFTGFPSTVPAAL